MCVCTGLERVTLWQGRFSRGGQCVHAKATNDLRVLYLRALHGEEEGCMPSSQGFFSTTTLAL